MKKLCLALLAATVMLFATAQTDVIYNWAKALNNNQYYSGPILADNVAVDMQGNVHVIGSFKGTADFDPNPVSAFHLTSVNNYYDIFIAKYDSNGNLIYAKQMGRYETSGATGDIAVDADGNVYVAGKIDISFFSKYDSSGELVFAYNPPFTPASIALDSESSILLTGTFLSTPDFNLGAGTASLTSTGSADIFVAKYDQDGNYLYAIGMGGTGDDSGNSIIVDEANNAYVTGYFSNTADFDPGVSTANLSSAGSYDVFLAKYDSAGNYAFAIAAGAAGNDRGLKVAVDNSGNALVTGYFNNTVDFNPGAGTANVTSNGGNDAFLAKYNGSGIFIYALGLGGTSPDAGASVSTDSSGSAYVAGYFRNTVDFDPGAGTANLTSTGQDDAFFAMYDAAGNYLFAKQLGGTNSDAGSDIAIDNTGKIIATGYFRGAADFDPGAGTSNLSGNTSNNNAFIGKYSGNGDYGWAIGILGYSNSSTEFQDEGRDIKTDASGNVYVTGSFSGTVDFDPGAGTQLLTSAGNTDIFLAKYDANGDFVFAFPLGASGQDGGYSLGLDAGSNIYLTGYFNSTVDFDPGASVVSLVSAGSRDIFLAKYSSSGAFIFANRMGASGSETAYSMALDANSNIYLAGNFESTVDFDPGIGSVTLTSAGGVDIFFAKYTSAGAFVYAKKIGGSMTDYAFDIAADASGIIYLTGYFTGTVDFDPGAGTVNLVSVGGSSDYDVYFAKYDISGNYVYANSIGTSSTQEQGYSITTDGLGNAYVSGTCSGSSDFDPGPGTVNIAGSGSFLAKYNTSGNYVYAMRIGLGYALYADGSGNTYVACSFQGTIDFDPDAGVKSLTAIGSTDIFIAKYDASGSYLFAKGFGGIDLDIAYGLALDASGNIHITGAFRNTADFDPGYGDGRISSTNSNDIFLAKYFQTNNSITTSALSESSLCAGASVDVSFTITGTYNAGNEFIAQLSNASGSFANPAVVGSLSGVTSGTINITIPQNASAGSGYRIRVVSSNPAITGTDNGSNIVIHPGCNDNNPCTDDVCTNGVCSYPNNTSGCDDADACTDNDACANGVCEGAPVNCDDNNTCTTDGCNPATGCTYISLSSLLYADSDSDGFGNPNIFIDTCHQPAGYVADNTDCDDSNENIYPGADELCNGVDDNCANGIDELNTTLLFVTDLTWDGAILSPGCPTCADNNINGFSAPVIWSSSHPAATVSKTFSYTPTAGKLVYFEGGVDDDWEVLVNGQVVQSDSDSIATFLPPVDITPYLINGSNTIQINATDVGGPYGLSAAIYEVETTCDDNIACTSDYCEQGTGCVFTPINCTADISGSIVSESGAPIPTVTLNVTGASAQSQTTPLNGEYIFNVDMGGNYTITPSKNNDSLKTNGITTLDITLIRRHLLGSAYLSSPYKIIAADVNSSNAVTTAGCGRLCRVIMYSLTR